MIHRLSGLGLRPHTQGSTYQVAEVQTARLKGNVSSSVYKSVSLNSELYNYLTLFGLTKQLYIEKCGMAVK